LKATKAQYEADLAELAKAGDSSACSELLQRYDKTMWSVARKMIRKTKRHEIDDLVQECYAILMYRRMNAFDRTKSTFCTWIHWQIFGAISKIINNTTSESKRRLEFAGQFSQYPGEVEVDFVDDRGGDTFARDVLYEICERLEHPQQSYVIRKMADGYMLKDIAPMLGVSPSRVQQIKNNAFEQSRELIIKHKLLQVA
jgi:RNA polymerase sigma factor (sigma-70 family)